MGESGRERRGIIGIRREWRKEREKEGLVKRKKRDWKGEEGGGTIYESRGRRGRGEKEERMEKRKERRGSGGKERKKRDKREWKRGRRKRGNGRKEKRDRKKEEDGGLVESGGERKGRR